MADAEKYKELYKKYVVKNLIVLIQEVLNNACEVGEGVLWKYVSDMVVDGAEQYVYDVYQPKVYKRRSANHGLKDPENVRLKVGRLSLDGRNLYAPIKMWNETVANEEYASGGYIAEDIIAGAGYKYDKYDVRHKYSVPRNFYAVYEEEYDPDEAGSKILPQILDGLQDVVNKAYEKAVKNAG